MRRLRAFTQQIMGMPISVHVRAHDADRSDIADAAGHVFEHLRKVDSVFSLYRPDSDLMRWRRGRLSKADQHPWVDEVADLCQRAHYVTGGLFTCQLPARGLAPGRSGGRSEVPREFDPTGLVKGWGVSGAAAYLDEVPDLSYCLNAAGDIAVGTGRGLNPAVPWRVGIEDPAQRGRITHSIEVALGSVATSGSAIRGDHFYDPRTDTWAESQGSATVIGPDLLWSDVWATAAAIDPQGARDLMQHRGAGYELILL